MNLPFKPGDVVMVCRHVYERSTCRVVQQMDALKGAVISDRFVPRRHFSREDGSIGLANFTVLCLACKARSIGEVDTIEQRWKGDRLIIADFAERSA